MYAGKSSYLISLLERHIIAGRTAIAFKPANDTRYSTEGIRTHSGRSFISMSIDINSPSDIAAAVAKYAMERATVDIVGVDESQFFAAQELIHTIENLAYGQRIDVIIAGLSQDSDGKPFGALPHLLAVADDIVHLKAVCAKSREINAATRTFRKVPIGGQILVGGTEAYEARSFSTWMDGKC